MRLVSYLTSLLLLVSSVYSLPKLNLQNILNNINVNDIINEVNNLGLNIDQDQINSLIGNELQNLLQTDKNLLSDLLNANNLLPLINNLTHLNLSEQSLLPILNSLMNQNATQLSQIFHNLLDNPQIKDILDDPSVQQSILNIINNPQSVNAKDLLNILIGVLNSTEMEEVIRKHLVVYIPDLASKLLEANSTNQVLAILEPIVSFHINYYLKQLNVSDQIESFLNNLDPVFAQLINNFFYTNTLDFKDLLNLLQPLVNSYITDTSLKNHLYIYLPDLLQRLSNAKTPDDFYQIAEYLLVSHFDNLEINLTKLILDNQFLNWLSQFKSIQDLLAKLSTSGIDDLKLSDLANVYLEYMNLPPLTESQLNHLNIYIPDLVNKLQSDNSSDLMSLLEPIISFHLNYYLNVNPQPLQNLINGLISQSPAISDLVNSLSNIQSALNLSQSEYNHLFVYIPEFLYNLTMAKDSTEIMNLIQQVLVLHLNNQNGSVLSLLDELLSDFSMSTLNTTVEPMFNTPQFVILMNDLIQVYTNGGGINQTKLVQDMLMVMAPPLMNTMKMAIYEMSPEIYEFAKDQSDPRVVVAYAVHAGESVLHDNLRAFGIPYDSVYLGATTTPVMTTTTPRRIIDVDLLNQIINLNKDKNDINNFLGNSGGNKPLVPFEPDNNEGGGNGGGGGGFDYF